MMIYERRFLDWALKLGKGVNESCSLKNLLRTSYRSLKL